MLNGLLVFHTAVAEFSRETVAKELGSVTALLSRGQALRADIRLMTEGLRASADDVYDSGQPGGRSFGNKLGGGTEERIGAAYVAAGSVLGGRMIAANLVASGHGDFPHSFLASDGLDVGRVWRDFKAALDEFGGAGADRARVISGALAAFGLICDIFSAPDVSAGVA